jgi:anti-sigma regulatory factor (Ser/Thr protein kinase)
VIWRLQAIPIRSRPPLPCGPTWTVGPRRRPATACTGHCTTADSTGRGEEFAAAIGEVISNALQHGQPPVHLDLYNDEHRWLCVITDHGPGIVDPWTGVDAPLPANPQRVGAGLCAARQLCDELVITTQPDGDARVRLLITTSPRAGSHRC